MLRVASLPALLLAVFFIVPGTRWTEFVQADEPKPVDFDRDVKPVFAKHCLSCHGPDKQRGDFRLDRKADAFRGGENGKLFTSGKAAESLLVHRVLATDDTKMPPKGERLSAAEITTLKTWIDQGAKWPDDANAVNPADWWSFKAIKKHAVAGTANPIDGFIRAKLSDKGLSPSPEADRRTLIRRVYFDLIGLPPSPEEVDAFVRDTATDAYEKLVEKLLASPQYGERWARYWLDVVHFGETHGYDKDKPRPNAWPYRDYVIRSLNEDKPYGRFVQEQLAGDVLFPGTVDGIVALGFLSAGPWDFIGHAELPESKIDGKIARHLDRDDFVANTMGTFMGLTVHCAQCHNHKFDPIRQEDYYRLQAVFAAIDRTDRTYDADLKVAARRAELQATKKSSTDKITAIRAEARKTAGPKLATLERLIAEATKPANATKPGEYGYHSALTPKQDDVKWVQVDLGESVKIDRVVLRPCNDDFNDIGQGFGFPLRFKIEVSDDAAFKSGTLIADQTTNDYPKPGMAPYLAKPDANKVGRYVRVTATKLSPRLVNDFMLALAELEAIDTEGKNRAAGKPVMALDSIEAPTRWRKTNLTDGLYAPGPGLPAAEVAKLTAARNALLKTTLGENGLAELAAAEAKARTADAELGKLVGSQRTAYIGAVHTGGGNFVGTGPTGSKPRPIHILARGDVTKPGKLVEAGAIIAIPGVNGEFNLPPNHTEGDRRAALAKWISSPENPLTWRVMANRVWQFHFGKGLVDTPNDFGKMGQLPTHPELLDFLAVELRDHQSLKKLHKLIVTSSTYKQVSATNEANAKLDGDNRFLWRQNRRKLEAEAVRDSILAVAGKLNLTMGGPSFQDFVIERPEHSPHYQYHLHDPEDVKAHRRAVYRYVVRSKQQPFMAALDCADPSLAVDKRNQTLTPQQALTLLNNKLAVAMAKHFAERVEKLGSDDAARVTAAVRLAFARDPTAKERVALVAYTKEHGLANACRVILNLNEFVFVDSSPYPKHLPTRFPMNRRDFLFNSGGGLGGIALASLLNSDCLRADGGLHHKPKAKRVVQLFMAGGASAVDLFDYKPELVKQHGKAADFGEHVEAFQNGLGPWLRPVWDFKPYGKSGKMLSETVSPLGDVVDEMAFVHNVIGKTGVHSQGTLLQTTGFNRPGFPSMGCWVSYGLGSANENLPTFVVLPDHRGLASNGTKNWDSAFLPAQHQGSAIYPGTKTPVEDLFPDDRLKYVTRAGDKAGIDLMTQLNREHATTRPGDERLDARIKSYELAAKMQLAAPEALDISKESAEVLKLYGLDHGKSTFDKEINLIEETDYFGRKCLVARRLLERGVRFVQIWSGNDNGFPRRNWDSHEDVKRDHGPLAYGMARGAAALIADLKRTGLLEDTIILWTTEFGRMPSSQGGKGRDHNPYCFTNWLAGGGIKPATTHGPSDDFGYKPADRKHPTEVYDLHATILHLLGIDHTKLTVRHNGIDRRLTDVHGHVINELIA